MGVREGPLLGLGERIGTPTMLYTACLRGLLRMVYGRPPEFEPGSDRPSALVFVADGVGGMNLCGEGLRHVAMRGESPADVRVFTWGHGLFRWHSDLTNVENHVRQSRALADAVIGARAEAPDRPIVLVGKSGGTGVVVRTLEQLEDGVVEAAVLIAPALSPSYDLTRALRAVRREMVVFWSPLDVIVLGVGTRMFGTIDRVHSISAGLVGFRGPEALETPDESESVRAARRVQYAKLRQVRWRPSMARTGYLGGHVGPDSPAFLERYVVPILRPGDEIGSNEGSSRSIPDGRQALDASRR